jgi:hypothetical protein
VFSTVNNSLPNQLVNDGKVVAMRFNEQGEKDFSILARVGHGEGRQVQASFQDLLPKDVTEHRSREPSE